MNRVTVKFGNTEVRVDDLQSQMCIYGKMLSAKCVCSVTQSCPSLYDPLDCSLSGTSVNGIFQARILEWVVNSYSGEIFLTQESNPCLLPCRQILYHWVTRKALNSILTPFVWKYHQIPQIKGSVLKTCSPLQILITSPGCCLCFELTGYKSETATSNHMAGSLGNQSPSLGEVQK